MILEDLTQTRKYRPQIRAKARFYDPVPNPNRETEWCLEDHMANRFKDPTPFRDRLPHGAPETIPNHEPEPRHNGSCLQLFDEAHDAPLWLIVDRTTGVVFARVRGSLMWIVDQIKLAAYQLGGLETDLYYRRAN